MFSRNGRNRPESKTTRMFRPVRQVAAPGAKSAISDCILLPVISWPYREISTLCEYACLFVRKCSDESFPMN